MSDLHGIIPIPSLSDKKGWSAAEKYTLSSNSSACLVFVFYLTLPHMQINNES